MASSHFVQVLVKTPSAAQVAARVTSSENSCLHSLVKIKRSRPAAITRPRREKVIEKLIGVDLPDDVVEKIIDGVKAKMTVDNVSKIAGALKGLF